MHYKTLRYVYSIIQTTLKKYHPDVSIIYNYDPSSDKERSPKQFDIIIIGSGINTTLDVWECLISNLTATEYYFLRQTVNLSVQPITYPTGIKQLIDFWNNMSGTESEQK